jgi:hypothetical protein
MAYKYFSLQDGSMELHNDRIVLDDEAVKRYWNGIIMRSFLLFNGLVYLFRGWKQEDEILVYLGALHVVAVGLSMLFQYKEIVRPAKEILLQDIVQVSLHYYKWQNRHDLLLQLKNGRVRRVQFSTEDNQVEVLRKQFEERSLILNFK